MNDICGLCFFFLFLLGSPIFVGGIFETVRAFIPSTQTSHGDSNAPPATAFVDSAMFLSMNDE